MIRHQAIAEDLNRIVLGILLEQSEVNLPVLRVEEHVPPCVATLRNVMRELGYYDSRQTRHHLSSALERPFLSSKIGKMSVCPGFLSSGRFSHRKSGKCPSVPVSSRFPPVSVCPGFLPGFPMWGITGFSFVFPQPFRATVNYFAPLNPPQVQGMQSGAQGSSSSAEPRQALTPGGKVLEIFSLAHYGNFAGWPVKALWMLLGLAPTALYFSALLMWWNRVLWPAMGRRKRGIAIIPNADREVQG
jgi:hypothetical protein